MVYAGKTLRRIQFNWQLETWCKDFHGTILDLGARAQDSYTKFLPHGCRVIATDINASEGIVAVDLNEPLPFEDNSMDVVTLFFVIYILEDQSKTLKEIHRVLKPGGKLYISTPLIAAEIREPHDYLRLTYEGLERLFTETGFHTFTIKRSGGRCSSAVVLLHPFFILNTIRLMVFMVSLCVDYVTRTRDTQNPVPHTYLCVLEK